VHDGGRVPKHAGGGAQHDSGRLPTLHDLYPGEAPPSGGVAWIGGPTPIPLASPALNLRATPIPFAHRGSHGPEWWWL
jgi:hypothetical protein